MATGVKVKEDPLGVPVPVGAVATVIVVELTTELTVVLAMVAPPAVDKVTESPGRTRVNPLATLVVIVVLPLVRVHPEIIGEKDKVVACPDVVEAVGAVATVIVLELGTVTTVVLAMAAPLAVTTETLSPG